MGPIGFFISYIEQLSYVAILILLFIGSIGIPFPEELVLLAAGYAASLGYMSVLGAILVCFIGVVLGDSIGYWIGKNGGTLFQRLLTRKNFRKVEQHFEKHGSKTIFISRFLAGIRVFFPIAAGATKMPLKEFLLWDILAATIWTPVVVLVGYWFGSFLPNIIHWLKRIDLVLGVAFACFLVILYLIIMKRKAIKKRIERLRHEFFTKPRSGETPYELLVFGDPEETAQRVYSKKRLSDGRISLFIEFLREGDEYKCLHSKHWLKQSSYHELVDAWSRKLGRPKKEKWD
jgi:membrane protein DedA with SNARE-associated domain